MITLKRLIISLLVLGTTVNASSYTNIDECNKAMRQSNVVLSECIKANNDLRIEREKCEEINEKITYELGKWKNTAQNNMDRYESEKAKLKTCKADKRDYLFKVPFIDAGITTSAARGFCIGFVTCLIII